MNRVHRAIQHFQLDQDFHSLIQRIPRVIGEQLDFERVLLFLREGERLEPVALWPGEELLTHARSLSEILLAEQPRIDAAASGRYLIHPSGYGIIPIQPQQDALGVLVVDRKGGIPAEELETLTMIADFAGLAILNARQLKELSFLHQLSNLLTASLDLDQVLSTLLRELAQLLPIDDGSILLVNKQKGGLVLSSSLNASAELGTPCTCPTALATFEENSPRAVSACSLRLRSGICAPLPNGVVCIGSLLPDSFRPSMSELVLSICQQATGAIANAQQYQIQKDLDQLKNEFLSTVSHELRTPLTSIKGFAATLLKPDLDLPKEAQTKIFHIIDEQANRLTNLIEEMLDVSRIESGRLQINLEETALDEVIQEAIASIPALEGVVETDLPCIRIPIDTAKVTQVMINLLSNALKYTPPGSRIRVEARQEDQGTTIRVLDQGEGIPPAMRPLLFQKFSRLDNSLTRKTGGTGLGLYIADRLVAAHGGRIWIEDAAWGQGACFAVFLPGDAPLKRIPKRD